MHKHLLLRNPLTEETKTVDKAVHRLCRHRLAENEKKKCAMNAFHLLYDMLSFDTAKIRVIIS